MKKITIYKNASINLALKQLKYSGTKCLIVLDKNNKLIGTLSDGDLRKKILYSGNTKGNISNVFNKNPHTIFEGDINKNRKKLKYLFIKKKLSIIPIIKKNNQFVKIYTYEHLIKKKQKKKKNNLICPVIIMAGGKGTRLKPFTNILPKPLMPINDKTVIEKIITNFKQQGFREFIITINYKSEILKAYFKELKLNVKIKIFEEKNPLGTVGVLSSLKKLTQDFILTNCDNIYNFEYSKMLESHKNSKNDLTMCTTQKKLKVPYGVCEIKNSNIIKIIEKPKYRFKVNAGIYVIKKTIIKLIKKNKKLDMDKFLLLLFSKNKKIGPFEIKENQWNDTGQWNELIKTIKKYS